MASTIIATFKTRAAAERTLLEFEALGITDKQISLIVTDETRGKSFNMEEDSKVDEGFAAGAIAGGLVGGLWGALGTATTMAIPGLNIVMVGAAVSVMAGLGTGAIAGGFIGALVGAGIPEHEAKIYEDAVKNGAIMLAVEPKDSNQRKQIVELLQHEDAYNLAA